MANTIDNAFRTGFAKLAGLVLTVAEVQQVVLSVDSTIKIGSMNIPDHVASARQAQQYATIMFERVGGGYKVLPRDKWLDKPVSGRGSNSQTAEQAKASLQAKLAALQTPSKPAVSTPTSVPSAVLSASVAQSGNKPNGAAVTANK